MDIEDARVRRYAVSFWCRSSRSSEKSRRLVEDALDLPAVEVGEAIGDSMAAAKTFSLSYAMTLLTGSSGSSEAMKWLEPSMTGPTRLSWIPAALMTEDRSLWRENPWLVS